MSIKLLIGDQIDCGSPVAIKTIPGEYELGFCCWARNITIDQYNSSVEGYAHCEGGYQSAWSLGNIMALMLIAYKQQLRIFFYDWECLESEDPWRSSDRGASCVSRYSRTTFDSSQLGEKEIIEGSTALS